MARVARPTSAHSLKFLQRIDRTQEHWVLPDTMTAVYYNSKLISPFRAIWAIYRDAVPHASKVRTTCGVQRCVRPEHLELIPMTRKARPRKFPGEIIEERRKLRTPRGRAFTEAPPVAGHGRPRCFDWNKARSLYAEGRSMSSIARQLGVSLTAIKRAVDDDHRALRAAQAKNSYYWQTVCADCGGKATRVFPSRASARPADEPPTCRSCRSKRRVAHDVRENELRCTTCRRWKPDEEFGPKKGSARRGRDPMCRSCATTMRQALRIARKVPCSRCGKLRSHPKDVSRVTVSTGLCRDCYQETLLTQTANAS